MRAEFSEAQRWRNLSEQGDDVHVLDAALGVGVVLAPQSRKKQARVRVQVLFDQLRVLKLIPEQTSNTRFP